MSMVDVLPPRSRLFHLNPIGIGTPYVESLSGYAARLAAKHSVTTNHLFSKELALHLNKPATICPNVNFEKFAKAVNGTGVMACDLTGLLERLTLRCNLRFTTLVPWAKVIAFHSLTRTTLAWCPVCYDEQLDRRLDPYDQLVWAIASVSVCARHKRPLETACPSCKHPVPHLTFRSRPGHCPKCGAWLGVKGQPYAGAGEPTELLPEEEWVRLKIAEWVGDFLAATASLNEPFIPSKLLINLPKLLRAKYHGRASVISRSTSVSAATIQRWLRSECLPSLSNLLKMCLALNVSLRELVCADYEEEGVAGRGCNCEPSNASGGGLKDRLETGKTNNVRVTREDWRNPQVLIRIEEELRAALDEHPPRSLTKVTAKINCDRITLSRKFPELTKKIAQNSLAYHRPRLDVNRTREVLESARSEEPPPSLNEISRRLGRGHSACTLRLRFPELTGIIVERYTSRFHRRINYPAIEKRLRASLKENPPASLASLCRELKVAESHVHRKLPDLCGKVRQRFLRYQREVIAERRSLVIVEITSNIKDMIRGGITPALSGLLKRRRVPCGSAHYQKECHRILREHKIHK